LDQNLIPYATHLVVLLVLVGATFFRKAYKAPPFKDRGGI